MRAQTLLLGLLVVFAPSRVGADSVGLLINETQFDTVDTEAVMLALTASVEGAGDTAVWLSSPEDVASASQALRSASCPIDCFQHYTAALGVQRVFAASVWRVEGGASIGMTYRAHGQQFSLSVVVAAFDAATLVPALDRAHLQLRRWDNGLAPSLLVVTEPAGAAVVVDGRPAGMTPLELPLSPSPETRELTVAVSLRGYETVRTTVTVPVEGEVNLELELELAHVASAGEDAPRSLAGPIAMTAVGAAGTVSVLALAAAANGCDVRDADGRCVSASKRNAAALGVYSAVAGVLLVGGVLWTIRVRDHNERSTTVAIGPGFIQVGGSF